VKLGMDTRAILARFRYERQALAMMDHPNIARVFEADETAKGRPYFVMEYIDGQPITTYCDRHRLNTKERLRLFIPVCQALQHAHAKGILHRDIKPSNVLVSEVDGQPVPKVIDFGIAKALDQQRVERSVFTQLGQFLGTPEYMSPEAADVVSGDVDTTSDVYSLGVLLYELLVGAVPFDGRQLRTAGLAELLRIIREVEAPPLPAKLTQLGKTLDEIAERRSTSPLTLRKQVAGELNLIALKAVEKRRERRYGSVQMLWEDVQRYLDDHPVQAQPPNVWYRGSKFVRRHKGMVAAGVAVTAALVVGVAATVWQANEARRERATALQERSAAIRERDGAARERAEAERQRTRAEASAREARQQQARAEENLRDVRDLAHSMLFELDEQLRDLGGTVEARRTLLRLGLRYLEKASANDPNLGKAYFRVGELQGPDGLRDLDSARESYGKALALLETKGANGDREDRLLLGFVQWRLSQLERAEERRRPRLRQAETVLRQLLAEREDADTLSALARVAVLGDRPEEGVRLAERAVALGNRPRHLVALSEAQLAMANWVVLRPNAKEVLPWAGLAVSSLEKALQAEPSNVMVQLRLVDTLLASSGYLLRGRQWEKAGAAVDRATQLATAAAALDKGNAGAYAAVARCWFQASPLRFQSGTVKEARAAADEALAGFRKQVARYPGVVQYRLDLAEFLVRISGLDSIVRAHKAALPALREAEEVLDTALRLFPENREARRQLAKAWSIEGMAHAELRDEKNATAAFARALAAADFYRKGLELTYEDREDAAELERLIGYYYARLGNLPKSLRHLEMSAAWCRSRRSQALETDARLHAWSYTQRDLASSYTRTGDVANARRVLDELRPVLEERYREGYEHIAEAVWNTSFIDRPVAMATYDRTGLAKATRRCIEVFTAWWQAWPEDSFRRWNYVASITNSKLDWMMAGDREAALAAIEMGRKLQLEDLADPHAAKGLKLDLMRTVVSSLNYLSAILDAPERAIEFGNEILRAVSRMAEDDKDNAAVTADLLSVRTHVRDSYLRMGQIDQALREHEVLLRLRAATATGSAGIRGQASGLLFAANCKERLGRTAQARADLDTALAITRELMSKESDEWEGAGAKQPRLAGSLEYTARLKAQILERLGRDREAMEAYLESVRWNERSETRNAAQNRSGRGQAMRLLRKLGSWEEAEKWAPADATSGEAKKAAVASATYLAGWECLAGGAPPERCAALLREAIALYAELPAEPKTMARDSGHASAWYYLALALRQTANGSEPSVVGSLEKAIAATQESRKIWQTLRERRLLPPQNNNVLMETIVMEDGLTARLTRKKAGLAKRN
ncbi:MAG: serine/threonine protein kinase, partial [Bryobacterales bacterium]|nr:serine/threonine protein kinase [Bryobacterales bacterium]